MYAYNNKNEMLSNRQEILISLYFALVLVGYDFITSTLSVFIDVSTSTSVTIPFRLLMLILSCIIFFFNRKFLHPSIFVFSILILFMYLRVVQACLFEKDLYNSPLLQKSISFLLLIITPYLLTSLTLVYHLNIKKVYRLCRILVFCAVVFCLANNSLIEEDNLRDNGNFALNSISYGHLGIYAVILSIQSLFISRIKKSIKSNVFNILLFILGVFVILKSASRGAFICFIILLFYSIFSVSKSKFISISVSLSIVMIIFYQTVLLFFAETFPAFFYRMKMFFIDGDINGRDSLYSLSLQLIEQNPMFGRYYCIPPGNVSHNIFLDFFIIGGVVCVMIVMYIYIIVWYKSYKVLNNRSEYSWLFLFGIDLLLLHLSSGFVYFSTLFFSLIPFLYSKNIFEK